MAESLEDLSVTDTDRVLDNNSFLNEKFEIFTHEYRESTEVHTCKEHGKDNSCESKEEQPYKKKDLVNTTRKLNRALIGLRAMKGNEVISEVLDKLQEINNNLIEAIKANESEFSTTTVDLPSFDNVDMELFLGEDAFPHSEPMLAKVANNMKAQKEKVAQLLVEADIMLLEYDHLKKGTVA